ncbi:MAG: hypothetical protein DHS20C18_20970 [Saprospiraceae bacterium]|nr:MAG: hypothetical protein DHS20C18_20970 [Saprospiraceae bacterium]
MLVYNITVKIGHEVRHDWVRWMKEVHIPEIMDTGLFVKHRMFRLLGVDETDGITYAIQYVCNGMTEYQLYQEKHAYSMQQSHHDRYKDNYVAFRTLMETV